MYFDLESSKWLKTPPLFWYVVLLLAQRYLYSRSLVSDTFRMHVYMHVFLSWPNPYEICWCSLLFWIRWRFVLWWSLSKLLFSKPYIYVTMLNRRWLQGNLLQSSLESALGIHLQPLEAEEDTEGVVGKLSPCKTRCRSPLCRMSGRKQLWKKIGPYYFIMQVFSIYKIAQSKQLEGNVHNSGERA